MFSLVLIILLYSDHFCKSWLMFLPDACSWWVILGGEIQWFMGKAGGGIWHICIESSPSNSLLPREIIQKTLALKVSTRRLVLTVDETL